MSANVRGQVCIVMASQGFLLPLMVGVSFQQLWEQAKH